MDVSMLMQSETTQRLISTIIRKMLFAGYAKVISINKMDPQSVDVQGCACNGSLPFVTTAKVINFATAKMSVSSMPVIGDKVLVVGLQSYHPTMFESPVTVPDTVLTDVQHYTLLGCVAIPMNVSTTLSLLRISTDTVGTAVTINEGTDPVVRWSELNSVLTSLWKAYNFHGHSAEGAGPPTITWENGTEPPDPPDPIPEGLFTDLASDVLKVPPKETP